MTAPDPASAARTETIQTAAAIMGNAIAWRRTSIQGPGLGMRAASPGTADSRRKGAAIPSASAVKTPSDAPTEWDRAYPTAAPMKGAVQGVATAVANIPLRKEAAPPFPRTLPPAS